MRIHTTAETITVAHAALTAAFKAGQIPGHVYFDIMEQKTSRTREYAAEVHMAASHKAPGDGRRYANTGHSGASGKFAASYDEWGWMLAHLFAAEPTAVAGPYKGRDSFNTQTRNAYLLTATD